MNKILCFIIVLCCNYYSFSQVGVGTTTPDASSILDIESTTQGLLVPRLSTAQRDLIANPAKSLFIYNTDNDKFEYNSGTSVIPAWCSVDNNLTSTNVYMGKFILSGTGNQTISGLPFKPTSIKFVAHANVESYNLNSDNGVGNNNSSFQNTFGSMNGYATNYNNVIAQQIIFIGASGNSVNDISRYASNTEAIGIRYCNQNGDQRGYTTASVTSFNADGFSINASNYTDSIVVMYEAYR